MFDTDLVRKQLQRMDIMATAHLCCAGNIIFIQCIRNNNFHVLGLPYCLLLSEFNSRYKFLADRYYPNRTPTNEDTEDDTKVSHSRSNKRIEYVQLIFDCYLRAVDDSALPYISNQWALGTRHVFLSHGAHLQLQTLKQMNDTQNRQSNEHTRRPPPPIKPRVKAVPEQTRFVYLYMLTEIFLNRTTSLDQHSRRVPQSPQMTNGSVEKGEETPRVPNARLPSIPTNGQQRHTPSTDDNHQRNGGDMVDMDPITNNTIITNRDNRPLARSLINCLRQPTHTREIQSILNTQNRSRTGSLIDDR
jgi:hypothetical protein